MGKYLDRLHEEFDSITTGVTAVLERAADEGRDLTDDEQRMVERDDTRRDELTKAIEHYTDVESRTGRVAELRTKVPNGATVVRTAVAQDEPYDILREFPTPADWAVTVHRALVYKDREAIESIERATAHQKTTDNPGLIPRPILGPVVNLITTLRPFIASITNRPLPSGKFDRPHVTQHVDVAKQAAEKDLTASRVAKIDNLPVTADTFAGHLNISRQDIKWTTPSILQIVFDDFAAMYAQQSDAEACTDFLASVTNTAPITAFTAAGITAALYGASANSLENTNNLPDTLWASTDVWGRLGGLVDGMGRPLFANMTPTDTSGAPLGVRLVVDPHFPAGTLVQGPSRFAEWYEDVDGLITVDEPDVLGQMVGYAGYGAFINVAPPAFTKFTVPAPVGGEVSQQSGQTPPADQQSTPSTTSGGSTSTTSGSTAK